MKMNKIVLAVAMASAMAAGFANAETQDQGHGTVKFTGSIIDAPCSIAPGKQDQTVDLGQVSNKALENGGTSTPKAFTIDLEGCDLDTAKSVTTTFTGPTSAGNADALGITGDAKGASIIITDGSGQAIKLGQASPKQDLQNLNNTLSFSAYLQGDGASATIVPGSFESTANFTLAYE